MKPYGMAILVFAVIGLYVLYMSDMVRNRHAEPIKTEQMAPVKHKANLNYLGVIANVYKTESVKVPAINDKHQAELMKAAE